MQKNIFRIFVLLLFSYSALFALWGAHATIATFNNGTNDETCVFCHTPHASRKGDGPKPLWNKPATALEISKGFTMYGATASNTVGQTMAGTPTTAQPQSPSLACLSCHDGVSAMNSVVNAPGAGNTDLVNGVIIGGADPRIMLSDPSLRVGYDGNLADDHPVSVEYIEGRGSLRPKNTTLTGFYGANVISDVLRNGKVECVSCHDPHGTPYGLYVRQQRSGSKICFACHDK